MITQAFATTCVPLFIMLSGALLLPKQETYRTFLGKRFSRILYPWVTWTIIYVIVAIYTKHLSISLLLTREFFLRLESFWFLPMICCLYLLTPITRILIQKARRIDIIFIVLLWFVGISFLPYTHSSLAFPRSVDDGLVRQTISFYGYFLLGYLIASEKKQTYWLLYGLLGILIGTAWTLLSVSVNKGILAPDFYNYIAPNIIFLSVGFFLFFIFIGNSLEKSIQPNIRKYITSLSTLALGIYFIHALMQQGFFILSDKSNFVTFFTPIDNFINGLILFIASGFVLYLITLFHPFKKYLL